MNRLDQSILDSNSLARNRARLRFRSVNRCDAPDYDPGLQRHHLLPQQLLGKSCFRPMLRALGRERLNFDDFRRNGLLLPANDVAAARIALPLHRGPHRSYNAMVMERVGQIERSWSAQNAGQPEQALCDALARLELLQQALRRRLLATRRRLVLNRRDPLGTGFDFTELDAMADVLWPDTEPSV